MQTRLTSNSRTSRLKLQGELLLPATCLSHHRAEAGLTVSHVFVYKRQMGVSPRGGSACSRFSQESRVGKQNDAGRGGRGGGAPRGRGLAEGPGSRRARSVAGWGLQLAEGGA